MHKLPVFAIAREAFAFVFREIGPILRLSWFPLLVVTAVSYFAVMAQLDTFREILASPSPDRFASKNTSMGYWDIISNVVTIVGTAVVAVALHRVILFDDRQPGTYVNLSFGKVEGLFVLLPILFFVVVVSLSVAVGVALAGLPAGLLALLAIIAVVAVIFLVVRYSLIFPIAVIERSYNFRTAWALSRGNFWRLLGLWLVVMIPPALVFLVPMTLLRPRIDVNAGSSPAAMATMIDQFETMLLQGLLMSYPASIIYGALGVAILSYSYKALTGRLPDEVVTPGV